MSKYKKVIQQSETHGYPLTIDVVTDNTQLEYARHDGKYITYKWRTKHTMSVKNGQEVFYTPEQLDRLIKVQGIFATPKQK